MSLADAERQLLPILLLISGKMGSGKSYGSAYLVERYGAIRWSRTELMKPLADALWQGAGDFERLLARVFPNDAEREVVRRELYEWIPTYEPEPGKRRFLYQTVVEICQRHDPLCFEVELADRIKNAQNGDFSIIDDVRNLDGFEYFSGLGYATLRIEASEEVRKARMLARDGYLPPAGTLNHYSETELDGVAHDFVVLNNSNDLDAFYGRLDRVVAALRSGTVERGANRML